MDQKIYMKILEGYDKCIGETIKGDCLKKIKALCGLAQAARQVWKMFTMKMHSIGFGISEVDPKKIVRDCA